MRAHKTTMCRHVIHEYSSPIHVCTMIKTSTTTPARSTPFGSIERSRRHPWSSSGVVHVARRRRATRDERRHGGENDHGACDYVRCARQDARRRAVDWMVLYLSTLARSRIDGMKDAIARGVTRAWGDVGVTWARMVCTDIVMCVLMRVIEWEEPCETERGDDDARFESRVSRRGASGR